MRSESTVLDKV